MIPEAPSRLRALFKKHDIPIFYIIAFSITWGGWLVMDAILTSLGIGADFGQLISEGHYHLILWPFLAIGAVWGPLLSAFIVYRMNYGEAGSRALLKKVSNWRVAITWYAIAIGVPTLIKYGKYVVSRLHIDACSLWFA